MLCFSVTQFILSGTDKFVCVAVMIVGNSTIHVCSSMYVVDVVIKGMVCIFLSLRATMNQ